MRLQLTRLTPLYFEYGGYSLRDGFISSLSSNTSFMHNPQVMESLSYQSIMDAFGKLLFGLIPIWPITTIQHWWKQKRWAIFPSIAGSESNPFTEYWKERSVSPSRHFSPLSNALELSQNITFSFMSSKIFQYVLSVSKYKTIISETSIIDDHSAWNSEGLYEGANEKRHPSGRDWLWH